MKTFEVLSLELYGPKSDWEEASVIRAIDHQEAVEKWAHDFDNDEFSIINRGEHGPILVREEGYNETLKFNIEARAKPVYYAREFK